MARAKMLAMNIEMKVRQLNQTNGTHWSRMPMTQAEIDLAWDLGLIHRVGSFYFVGRA